MFTGPEAGIQDKVVLIAGGSKGIGAECARQFASLGAQVAIAGRNAAAVDATLQDLRGLTREENLLGLQADLSSLPQINYMVDETRRRFGSLDVLVNSAGTNIRTPALDVTEADWDTVMDVNLKGAFFAAQAFARTVAEDGTGKIINISSQYGHVGSADRVTYCSSKGGVELMTKSLAVEWAPRILVNNVCPTFIETDLTREMLERTGPQLLGRMPMGRFGAVQDVTGAVLYLASDWSRMVTGTSLMVDGGWTAG